MLYHSSRGQASPVSAAQAITMGIATDGGLFVPEDLPHFNEEDWQKLQNSNYQQRAVQILQPFLTEFTGAELEECAVAAYHQERFDNPAIAPLVHLQGNTFIQELWHGPTCAFKDMALQMLPHLLTRSMGKTAETDDIVILVATWDTGKAALKASRILTVPALLFFTRKKELVRYKSGR